MTTIYFIRHAASDSTVKDGRIRPLTPQGIEAAQRLVTQLSDIDIDIIYSSPFKRAIDTVLPLAQSRNLNVNIVDDFRERKSDSVQTMGKHELTQKQWRDFTYTLSDGECFNDVQSRNIGALKQVLSDNKGKSIVIGTHGVALCTMIRYYKPVSEIDFERILLQMPYIVKMRFESNEFVDVTELCLVQ